MPDFTFENKYHNKIVAGVDEVGRGPLAGPVLAVATILNLKILSQDLLNQIDDSKKLSKKKLSIIAPLLMENSIFAVGMASVAEIEHLNILNASILAMKRAIDKLQIIPHVVLVDGIYCPKVNMTTVAIKKGDSKSLSIAAASIIAKVIRDKLMLKLAKIYPNYGWDKNCGYPTPFHINALKRFGITPHHRKTFAPVKSVLLKLHQ